MVSTCVISSRTGLPLTMNTALPSGPRSGEVVHDEDLFRRKRVLSFVIAVMMQLLQPSTEIMDLLKTGGLYYRSGELLVELDSPGEK
jgi:hypothetical protein